MSKRPGRGHGRRSVAPGPHGVRGRRGRRPSGGGARPRVEVGRGRVVRGVVEHGRVGVGSGRGGRRSSRVALLLLQGHAQGRGRRVAAGSTENEREILFTTSVIKQIEATFFRFR